MIGEHSFCSGGRGVEWRRIIRRREFKPSYFNGFCAFLDVIEVAEKKIESTLSIRVILNPETLKH